MAIEQEAEISLSNVVKGSILDLMFHQDGSYILIQGSGSVQNLSLATFELEKSVDLDDEVRWICHPADKSRIVGFSTTTALVLDWNLETLHSYALTPQSSLPIMDIDFESEIPVIEGIADRILASSNGKHILVQVSSTSSEKLFFYIDISSLTSSKSASKSIEGDTIGAVMLPEDLGSQISLVLGFAKDNRLVFLSNTSSVCSVQI